MAAMPPRRSTALPEDQFEANETDVFSPAPVHASDESVVSTMSSPERICGISPAAIFPVNATPFTTNDFTRKTISSGRDILAVSPSSITGSFANGLGLPDPTENEPATFSDVTRSNADSAVEFIRNVPLAPTLIEVTLVNAASCDISKIPLLTSIVPSVLLFRLANTCLKEG